MQGMPQGEAGDTGNAMRSYNAAWMGRGFFLVGTVPVAMWSLSLGEDGKRGRSVREVNRSEQESTASHMRETCARIQGHAPHMCDICFS